MNEIFHFTYELLMTLSNITGFTYKEVNIIIWFILIPLSWTLLIDKIYKQRKFTIIFSILVAIFLALIPNFSIFCNWLFQRSVDFLNLFNDLGSNYVASSVIICVLIPIIIYSFLIWKAFFKKSN